MKYLFGVLATLLFLPSLADAQIRKNSSGTGSSVPTGILFNDSGTVNGTAAATLDSSGNATFRTVGTDDLDPENVMVLTDNTAGMTKAAPTGGDLGVYVDSSTTPGYLFVQDASDNRYSQVRYETDGSVQDLEAGVNTCLSGLRPAPTSADTWCFNSSGNLRTTGPRFDYSVSSGAAFNVTKTNYTVEVPTLNSEATTRKIQVLGNAGGTAATLQHRYWIDSDDLHQFFVGDGDSGIGLYVGNQASFRTRLYPKAGLGADNDIGFPDVDGVVALDAGNIEDSATETLLDTEMYGGFFVATANAFTYTLPAGVEGMHGCFWARTAAVFTIDPNASDFMYLIGTGALGDGVSVSSAGGLADSVCVRADSAGNWMMYAQNGTFVTP